MRHQQSLLFQTPGTGGPSHSNLFHLLLQGVQGVGPGQQLLEVAQLSILLLGVLLLLLPLLFQGCYLRLVAADGVCGRGGRAFGA